MSQQHIIMLTAGDCCFGHCLSFALLRTEALVGLGTVCPHVPAPLVSLPSFLIKARKIDFCRSCKNQGWGVQAGTSAGASLGGFWSILNTVGVSQELDLRSVGIISSPTAMMLWAAARSRNLLPVGRGIFSGPFRM